MARPVLKQLKNIHHAAYRCLDAEQTRWFYEEVMGLPMRIAFAEEMNFGEAIPRKYLHIFFEMADGNYVAFFDHPDSATPEHFTRKDSFDLHLAFEVDTLEELLTWQKNINAKGRSCFGPIDHGFVQSIYVYDPNGIQVEITCRNSDTTIFDKEVHNAKQQLAAWSAETRALKLEKFGDKIDRRGNPTKVQSIF